MRGGIFEYWGKADTNYAGEATWHPLVYHCLDVAACLDHPKKMALPFPPLEGASKRGAAKNLFWGLTW